MESTDKQWRLAKQTSGKADSNAPGQRDSGTKAGRRAVRKRRRRPSGQTRVLGEHEATGRLQRVRVWAMF